MTVLFGHPTGNPNSHQAALAHFETGRLEAFCTPWMPSEATLRLLNHLPLLDGMARRLARRHFPALAAAPKIQGRAGEWLRLAIRTCGRGDERLSYTANDWLMEAMTRKVSRVSVRAVHVYEDCSLLQFLEAKRLGKACIYDMPIGYYEAWRTTQDRLARVFTDWLPPTGSTAGSYARPRQKREEMELADLVLTACNFAAGTIRDFFPKKQIAQALYGVDAEFWSPGEAKSAKRPLRFIYAGQLSLRKGTPGLIEAWRKAALSDAELELVGAWLLANDKRRTLPATISHRAPQSALSLRERFRDADVFVFPSYFEGFGLVLAEAMACGLPVIASTASVAPEIVDESCGRLVTAGDLDGLIDALRWFCQNRDCLPQMSQASRRRAEQLTWARYRRDVTLAVSEFA